MTIDWLHFTPYSALLGGLLIGIAVTVLILFNGRIAGISGIFSGMFTRARPVYWRIAFIFGLLSSSWFYQLFTPLPPVTIESSNALLIIAGLLVGLGSRFASGCTSGHSVCGLARLSPRSIVATLLFISMGMLVVFIMRHLLA